MVSKDLGLAAPGRLTVWAETKGKSSKGKESARARWLGK